MMYACDVWGSKLLALDARAGELNGFLKQRTRKLVSSSLWMPGNRFSGRLMVYPATYIEYCWVKIQPPVHTVVLASGGRNESIVPTS
jgi:hypothetical protein